MGKRWAPALSLLGKVGKGQGRLVGGDERIEREEKNTKPQKKRIHRLVFHLLVGLKRGHVYLSV